MKPTVVIDTNLFIAGRWNPKSNSNKILDMVLNDEINAVYTYEIKNENLYILEKVRPSKDFLDKIIRYYQHAEKVFPTRKVNVCKEDPSDNRFLEAADAGNVEYIISSDKHLLDIGFFAGARIVKPYEFLNAIGKPPRRQVRKGQPRNTDRARRTIKKTGQTRKTMSHKRSRSVSGKDDKKVSPRNSRK